jgi:2-polyprenyl-6-methoxyphenol hydroxylase-like FAD-dependent oxidoreductase
MDERTGCVVVGGGPGGAMLAYLLARGGVAVALLESRGDFDRRFRGDSTTCTDSGWPSRCWPRSRT